MSCEKYEIDLSSFLDGELPPEAAAEAVEHALDCAECAAFYRAARRVQSAAARLRDEDGELGEERADSLWRSVAARAGEREARGTAGWRQERAEPATRRRAALRAAALVALGLGGGYLFALLGGPGASAAGAAARGSTVLASTGSSSTMDEHRFVAVADELLSADVRYQRAMLEVLRLVPALESGEGLRSEDEPRVVRASNEERPGRGAI
jgi:anti-sigma factor RsiW